jgi:hypothetical protein
MSIENSKEQRITAETATPPAVFSRITVRDSGVSAAEDMSLAVNFWEEPELGVFAT